MVRIFLVFLLFVSVGVSAQMPLATKSKKAIALYTEADNFRVRGQFSQAIQLLNEALQKDRKFVEAYYRLGIIYMTLKDYPSAIGNFEKGLSFTDDIRKKAIFWYDLGESYFNVGDYDKAEETLSGFLKAEVRNRAKIERAKQLMDNIAFAREHQRNSAAWNQKRMSDTVNAFVM